MPSDKKITRGESMNLMQLIDLKTGTSIAVFLFLFLMTIIQIAPIKLNPWDKILALVNKMWLQLGIFAIIFVAGAVILLMSFHIPFWIDILKESLRKCRNE